MSHKSALQLNRLIAEESQLVAEEKWILDALTKIRNQRNCLQIERLHLESLKTQMNMNEKPGEIKKKEETPVVPSTSAVNLMQNSTSSASYLEFEVLSFNNEKLNLDVQQEQINNADNAYEMEEEDDDDVEIDMNMFMNGGL